MHSPLLRQLIASGLKPFYIKVAFNLSNEELKSLFIDNGVYYFLYHPDGFYACIGDGDVGVWNLSVGDTRLEIMATDGTRAIVRCHGSECNFGKKGNENKDKDEDESKNKLVCRHVKAKGIIKTSVCANYLVNPASWSSVNIR